MNAYYFQMVTDENKELHAEIQDLVEEQMKKISGLNFFIFL